MPNMDATLQRSLAASLKKLTNCARGEKELDIWTKHRVKQRPKDRGLKARRCATTQRHVREPVEIRAYQAELDRERKQREAMNVQKNADRAAMREHFRRKYQLPQDAKDASHLRAAGGNVSLPQELLHIIQPEAQDQNSALLKTFKNLNMRLSSGLSKRNRNTAVDGVDKCSVM